MLLTFLAASVTAIDENGEKFVPPVIENDAVIFGMLMLILGAIFLTNNSSARFWKRFYGVVPALLLCYFLPSVLTAANLVNPEATNSQLYFVASRYLLPACLVLLTLSIDFKGLLRLGPKAIIMFLTGTVGIIIGGPIAVATFSWLSPETLAGTGDQALWRGLSTVAGSWIGGGANQAAMYEVYKPSANLFSQMITVDVIVANIWMAILLIGVGKNNRLDRALKADSSAITRLQERVSAFRASIAKMPTLTDLMTLLMVGFAAVGLAHWLGDGISGHIKEAAKTRAFYASLKNFSLDSNFFWLVVIATTVGLVLSFTRARQLEGAGASRVGSAFIYILVATIGLKMNVMAIFKAPELFLLGLLWMAVHAGLLILVAKLIKAPFFYVAVGSQANVGGAASAPVVAGAFHPSLAPVGVLMAVLGYALGTYGAYFCAELMRGVVE